MTNEEVIALLEECKALYSAYASMYNEPKIVEQWFKLLANYDVNDIYASLERHKEGNYSRSPISLVDLIRYVPTIKEKNDKKLENYRVCCRNCGRYINYFEAEKHEDRCRSIDYIVTQYKKWFHKEITKQFLWSLSDKEFDERYDKLLHYIHDNTLDSSERTRIGFIFNPPSEEEAKAFLNGGNNG